MMMNGKISVIEIFGIMFPLFLFLNIFNDLWTWSETLNLSERQEPQSALKYEYYLNDLNPSFKTFF